MKSKRKVLLAITIPKQAIMRGIVRHGCILTQPRSG
jgi:hypothetical protein